jgi:DNA-binding Xre family transcriptional regulator
MGAMIELRLAELLRRRTPEEGNTFYWLAKTTGLNHAVVFKLRHNTMKQLGLDVIERVCEVLDCEPGDWIVRVKKGRRK